MLRGAFLAVAMLVALPGVASATASSSFDSDAQSWRLRQNSGPPSEGNPSHSATGGNPGGHIFGTDVGAEPGEFMRFISPNTVASGWPESHAENTDGTFSFDLKASGTPARGPFPNLVAYDNDYLNLTDFMSTPSADTWTHYSVTLNETSGLQYCTSSGDCASATRAQVVSVLHRFLQVHLVADTGSSTGEVVRLDNPSFSGGALPPDGDGDGWPDLIDDCPDLDGWSNDGCPIENSLTLKYKGGKRLFKGVLASEENLCTVGGQTVTIHKRKPGPDPSIATATTSDTGDGAYSVKKRASGGKYYSSVAHREIPVGNPGNHCAAAESPIVRIG
jgi:hypothetical protein